jgi:hypothetical protein
VVNQKRMPCAAQADYRLCLSHPLRRRHGILWALAAMLMMVFVRAGAAARSPVDQRDSVSIGSTFIARRAGTNDASTATASNAAAIAPNVTGSNGLTPNSI